jgi:hypothetical protein
MLHSRRGGLHRGRGPAGAQQLSWNEVMQEQLVEIIDGLEEASGRLRRLEAAYTNAEWIRRPTGGGWSAAECVAHLNLTSEAYIPLLARGLSEARTVGSSPPARFRRDPVGWLIWRSTRPEAKVRVKTTPSFVPREASDKIVLCEDFARLQEEQLAAVRAADGLPIHRVKVKSPFAKRVYYSLYSGLTILPAHQHRHLAQAERAVASVRATAK